MFSVLMLLCVTTLLVSLVLFSVLPGYLGRSVYGFVNYAFPCLVLTPHGPFVLFFALSVQFSFINPFLRELLNGSSSFPCLRHALP